MIRPLCLLLLAAALLPAAAPVPAELATVTIRVANVRNANGRIHVDLCDQARFLREDCPYAAAAPAQSPVTVVVVRGVAPGHYAAQLFHDENGNDKTDRNLLGIPKEGIAFSRDASLRLTGPRWADAEVAVAPGTQGLAVRMRYLLGASGPQAR